MANASLFKSSSSVKPTDTRNNAGAAAFCFDDKHALIQLVSTGTLHDTFYTTAEEQLAAVLGLATKLPSMFIAQAAVYAREKAYMKDSPALLCAVLAARKEPEALDLLSRVFPKVITNGRMLRTFVQIVRSAATGRMSFGSAVRRMIRDYLEKRSPEKLFEDALGETPSLADIIRMTHPKASTPERAAFYGYLLGKNVDMNLLPQNVRDFEAYKKDMTLPVPNVPHQYLTGLSGLPEKAWETIAVSGGWHFTKMNLNTFQRRGLFANKGILKAVSAKLADGEQVRKNRVLPYQLLAAWKAATDVPAEVRNALQTAVDHAVSNIPSFDGVSIAIGVDVSGSMSSPVMGKGTSNIRCSEAAAMIASAILRVNPNAKVIPFDTAAKRIDLNARDSVMTNTTKLGFNGGGTDVSVPLQVLSREKDGRDLVIILSDNESWYGNSRGATSLTTAWKAYKKMAPKAKLVCIDLCPNRTTQAPDDKDVLNIGGFSDSYFGVIESFASGKSASWVKEVEAIAV